MKIDVGDVVLKEKQIDISRKGEKLHDRYNTSTYTVDQDHAEWKCCVMFQQIK